jgi:hypothetical protein
MVIWPQPPPEPKPEPEAELRVRDALTASGLNQPKRSQPPDLDTQFEDLLGQIYDSERRERILDRVDAAIRNDEEREKRRKKAGK